MMLTKEQVEALKRTILADDGWSDLARDQINTLCDMALAWLAVQPRPIEEAPDKWVDERCLVWVDPHGVETRSVTDGIYWKMANRQCVAKGEPPLYLSYLPLSALPNPGAGAPVGG